jgi:hypothetical protein
MFLTGTDRIWSLAKIDVRESAVTALVVCTFAKVVIQLPKVANALWCGIRSAIRVNN